MSPRTPNRGIAWLQCEVNALLDIWTDKEIQEQLAGRLHNMCIYEKISRRLKGLGFNRSGEQCREKIKKLRRDYKTVVHNNYSPIFARRLLGFYDKVHKIFGNSSDLTELPDVEINVLKTDNSEILGENHNDQSDTEIEFNMKSFSDKNPDTSNALRKNTTSDIHSSIDSIKQVENSTYKFTEGDEKILQNIYQNGSLLQETLKNRQVSLNNKFTELEKTKIISELDRGKKRLLLLEYQRKKAKSQELKLYEALLQFIASSKGFQIKFDDSMF